MYRAARSGDRPATEEYRILCGSETLACSVDRAESGSEPSVLCLHGGGPSNRSTIGYLSRALRAAGKTVVRFDFSGQGDSSGSMPHSSLEKRVIEAIAVLNFFGMEKRVDVIGTSMGGYVASVLAARVDVANLVLFCPAAYSAKAFSVAFGYGFSQIIRSADSFLETDIVRLLKGFSGSALHIIGSEDEIIPKAVTDLYFRALTRCVQFETTVIEGCPHPIHKWLADKDEKRSRIEKRVVDFLS